MVTTKGKSGTDTFRKKKKKKKEMERLTRKKYPDKNTETNKEQKYKTTKIQKRLFQKRQ